MSAINTINEAPLLKHKKRTRSEKERERVKEKERERDGRERREGGCTLSLQLGLPLSLTPSLTPFCPLPFLQLPPACARPSLRPRPAPPRPQDEWVFFFLFLSELLVKLVAYKGPTAFLAPGTGHSLDLAVLLLVNVRSSETL